MTHQPQSQPNTSALLKVFGAVAVIVLIAVVLTGCGTQIVYVPQYAVAVPPDALLLDCEVEPPPYKDKYLAMTPKEKEGALTDTLTVNYGFQTSCNKGKAELRQWKVDQLIIYEKKNTEARSKIGGK